MKCSIGNRSSKGVLYWKTYDNVRHLRSCDQYERFGQRVLAASGRDDPGRDETGLAGIDQILAKF